MGMLLHKLLVDMRLREKICKKFEVCLFVCLFVCLLFV
jgi:hypothetical protein